MNVEDPLPSCSKMKTKGPTDPVDELWLRHVPSGTVIHDPPTTAVTANPHAALEAAVRDVKQSG